MLRQCQETYPDHGAMLSSTSVLQLFLPRWEGCTHGGWLWWCVVCRGVVAQGHMCSTWYWAGGLITPSEGEHGCCTSRSESGHQETHRTSSGKGPRDCLVLSPHFTDMEIEAQEGRGFAYGPSSDVVCSEISKDLSVLKCNPASAGRNLEP